MGAEPSDRASDDPATRSVHAGARSDPATGAINTPVYRSSTFRFDSTDDLLAELQTKKEEP